MNRFLTDTAERLTLSIAIATSVGGCAVYDSGYAGYGPPYPYSQPAYAYPAYAYPPVYSAVPAYIGPPVYFGFGYQSEYRYRWGGHHHHGHFRGDGRGHHGGGHNRR